MKQKNCPACGQSIQITPAMAGTTIRCPHCKHGLKVPPRATPTSPPGISNSELAHSELAHSELAHSELAHSDSQPGDTQAAGPPVIVDVHKSTSANVERYRKRQNSRRLAISATVCIICCVVAAAIMYSIFTSSKRPTSQRVASTPLRFTAAKDLRATEGVPISQPLTLTDTKKWIGNVAFELVEGPTGASVDAQSGTFSWKPDRDTPTKRQRVTVLVQAQDDPQTTDSVSFWVTAVRENTKPTITLPTDVQVVAGETVQTTIVASDSDQPPSPLLFSLTQGPRGATLNAKTGELQWTPPVDTPAGNVLFTIGVREAQEGGLSVRGQFRVRVTRPERPIDAVVTALREQGLQASVEPDEFEHPFSGNGALLRVDGEEIRFFEYATEQAVRDDALKIAKDRASLQMPKLPASWVGPARYFRKGNLLFVYAGLNPDLVEKLTRVLGEPLESSTGSSTASTI